ncbi:hypothetical protein NM688_g4988 [Phlebia brevispora]|uniref:Uncharacterized protein n=1 Tax=Phlebia brevispora TaxID=194682 RepID=A0ACC1T1I2_9APHY|nr:hypothetical protein NM688_g4988 [Phlebia brevispora]
MFAGRAVVKNVASIAAKRRGFKTTATWRAITNFNMPAMSPTMTEGGIASWKVKEGQKFSGGDVLLEIETDKATIDVEAQDDGVMGKILVRVLARHYNARRPQSPETRFRSGAGRG